MSENLQVSNLIAQNKVNINNNDLINQMLSLMNAMNESITKIQKEKIQLNQTISNIQIEMNKKITKMENEKKQTRQIISTMNQKITSMENVKKHTGQIISTLNQNILSMVVRTYQDRFKLNEMEKYIKNLKSQRIQDLDKICKLN